jgi:glycosyltransferase involved in cell wall biosynthesis
MRVIIDFTGPMSTNTGGATYPSYVLPRWTRLGEDTLAAVYSHGQVPSELSGLDCILELPRRTGRGSLDRVIDMHLGLRGAIRMHPIDVAFFPGNFIPLGLPAAVPKVVAINSTLFFDYPAQVSPARGTLQRLAMRYTVRAASRIIVPSSRTADVLMRIAGARRRQLVVIPHGVDLDLFAPGDDAAREPSLFLFVSKPRDYKGLLTVLRALREVNRRREANVVARLVVVDGGLSRSEYGDWQALASRLGVERDVDFAGRLSHPQLSELYRRARTLVLPSSTESFGWAYLEAAAAGCLVIGPPGHGLDETVGDEAIAVPAHDHLALGRAMEEVSLMSVTESAERASRLRSLAERFSWDETLARTREVLAEVA